MRLSTLAAALTVLFAASLLSTAKGDETPAATAAQPQTPDNARTDTLDWEPDIDETDEVLLPIPEQRRPVLIHEMSLLRGQRKVHQGAHRPVFLTVQNPAPAAGVPACMAEAPYIDEYGRYHCKIDIILSSAAIRAAAEKQLRARHAERLVAAWNLDGPASISVRRWPIKHLVLRAYDDRDQTLLATAESQPLGSNEDVVQMHFRLTFSDYTKFVDAYRAKKLRFDPFYTFVGRNALYGEQRMDADVESKIKQKIKLLSDKTGDPQLVTHSDAFGVITNAMMNIERRVLANDASIVALLESPESIFDLLFQQEDKYVSEMMDNQALLQRAWAQMQAAVRQFQRSTGKKVLDFEAGANEEQRRRTAGREKTKTTTEGGSVAAGGGVSTQYGTFGGSAAYQKNRRREERDYSEDEETQSALDAFERSTGTMLVRAEGGTDFVPLKIFVYRTKVSETEISLRQVKGVYLGIRADDRYLADTPVFAHWGQDILSKGILPGE